MQYRPLLLASVAMTVLPLSAALPAVAMADPLPRAETYADLLEPVPDAGSLLAADDASREGARFERAQYWRGDGNEHHHHHHHHHHSRRWYSDHGYYWNGGGWAMRPRHHHHHHHHHHNQW